MIDHVLLDIIGSLRQAFEGALLEQQAVEERFQVDVFLGDVSFETSYSLPGEHNPPRVRADISLEWPTWSQSAYRSWSIGEAPSELPELLVEVRIRLQRLASPPDPTVVQKALGNGNPFLAGVELIATGPTVEQIFETDSSSSASSIEIAYQGAWRLEEAILEEPENLDSAVTPLARYVASALVRLADLDLPFLPAITPEITN